MAKRKEKKKKTNNDLQNATLTAKDSATRNHRTPRVNPCAWKLWAFPVQLVINGYLDAQC